MDNIDSTCVENLENNSKEVYLLASEILLKLLKNILDNPEKESFKSIRLSNPNISSKLLKAKGAKECLIKIGFIENNDRLTLSPNIDAKSIYQYYEYLLIRRTMIISQNETLSLPQCDIKVKSNQDNKLISEPKKSQFGESSSKNMPSTSKSTKETVFQNTSRILKTSNAFLKSIEDHSISVLAYENPVLLKRALSCIPVVMLQTKATERMREIQKSIKTEKRFIKEPLLDDLILLELLEWFKKSFFTWVDKPACDKCGNKNTNFAGNSSSCGERVEIYYCDLCNFKTTFTRHCDPGVLLNTRKGRCGEWANCFTLLCRAMGWSARYVVDDSDHVWTEVYSEGEERWLHCDPCENACDTPLMYEQGWGKHPRYIIAYSCDDVQDVTWRYTVDHKGALKRRTLCSEKELLMVIEQLRYQRQKNLSKARQKYLIKRNLKELVELMTPRVSKESEKQGRTSGSLSWRLSRGETKADVIKHIWYIDQLSDEIENHKKVFKLYYSISNDVYICYGNKDNVLKSIKGWSNGLYHFEDVFRKEEQDWKMVYLARKENSLTGKLIYRFAFNDNKYIIDEVKVKIETDVFENGNISCCLCSKDACVKIKQDKSLQNYKMFHGQKYIELSIDLSGGKGSVAWQHAQVFRQHMDSKNYPLQIEIIIKEL